MKIEIVGNTEKCRPCRELKAELIEKGIEFTFLDTSDSSSEVVSKVATVKAGSNSVIPALFIDGVYHDVPTARDVLVELKVI